jgi:hypothetical protein
MNSMLSDVSGSMSLSGGLLQVVGLTHTTCLLRSMTSARVCKAFAEARPVSASASSVRITCCNTVARCNIVRHVSTSSVRMDLSRLIAPSVHKRVLQSLHV